jgi:hypothetical protein
MTMLDRTTLVGTATAVLLLTVARLLDPGRRRSESLFCGPMRAAYEYARAVLALVVLEVAAALALLAMLLAPRRPTSVAAAAVLAVVVTHVAPLVRRVRRLRPAHAPYRGSI